MSYRFTGSSPNGRDRNLEQLMAQARDNELMLKRIRAFELKLMAASDIVECVRLLLSGMRGRFNQDIATLWLVDSDHIVRRAVSEQAHSGEVPAGLRLVPDESTLGGVLGGVRHPQIALYDPRLHAKLFDSKISRNEDGDSMDAKIGSVCIIPFVRGAALLGCLNLASRNPERNQPNNGTDFLGHLGAVAAVSIEAVVARHQLRTLGLTDALTGVSNRRFFDQRLEEETARARREKIPLSLLFVDVDHFKQVNDSGGHALGDQILCDVATAIQSEVRVFDVVSRFGGDEFAVLLIGASRSVAREIAERTRQSVENIGRRNALAGIASVTASVGIASVDRTAEFDAERLLAAADRAVYDAKAAGRNRLMFDQNLGTESPYERLPKFLLQ